ncbi:hypothetical protein [Nocardiopsis coralliicola]
MSGRAGSASGAELVWESGAGVEERLAAEVLASAGFDAGVADAAGEAAEGAEDAVELLGTVVARRGGELLGWASVMAGGEGDPVAEWALASFEEELAVTGSAPERGAEPGEVAVVQDLVWEAAQWVRGRGFGGLLWAAGLPEADAAVAERLGAAVHREEGRDWSGDVAAVAVSAGEGVREVAGELPAGRLEEYAQLFAAHAILHPFPEEWDAEDVAEWLGGAEEEGDAEWLLASRTFDLVGGRGEAPVVAQVTVLVDREGAASVARVVHHGVPAGRLAGLLGGVAAALEGSARRLSVREFDDAVVAGACREAGLSVERVWPVYRLSW